MHTFDQIRESARETGWFGFDLECESITDNPRDAVNPRKCRITHIALSTPKHSACYNVGPESTALMVELLTDPRLKNLVQNSRYDYQVLHWTNTLTIDKIQSKLCDTLGLGWMIDEEEPHGLKYMVQKYCNMKMTTYDEVMATSDTAIAYNNLNARHSAMRKVYDKSWISKVPKRPYPNFDSPLTSRAAVRRQLRADGASIVEAKEQVEALWSEDCREEYRVWFEGVIRSEAEHKKRLEARMDEDMKKYARGDAARLFNLYRALAKRLRKEQLDQIVYIEMAVVMESIKMQIHGMPMNLDVLRNVGAVLDPLIEQFKASLYDMAKQEFNPGSSDQLRRIFFIENGIIPPPDKVLNFKDGLEMMVPKLTPAGQKWFRAWQTGEKVIWEEDEEPKEFRDFDIADFGTYPEILLKKYLASDTVVLERIAHPMAQEVLNYRVAAKLKTTYIDGFITSVEESGDGRIHGSFNPWGTDTGRFSCVHSRTLVDTDKGLIPISEINAEHEVVKVRTHTDKYQPVRRVFSKGEALMYNVVLYTGASIVCTADHEFATPDGWAKTEDLIAHGEICISERSTYENVNEPEESRRWQAARIKSIKEVGTFEVWDMEVENDGSYVAAGFINHNSSAPNLQNIPSRGKSAAFHPDIQKIGPSLRTAFVAPEADDLAPEGYKLIVGDHSQIELRLIACMCDEQNLKDIYLEHVEIGGTLYYTGDVHQRTADAVGSSRKDAKAVNFGFNYGMGPEKYAKQNRIFIPGTVEYDIPKCAAFRTGFFRAYKNIQGYMRALGNGFRYNNVKKFATIGKRIRHFYKNDSVAPGRILNAKIQGSGADLLKYNIYIIAKYLYERYPGLQLIGQVHDEIIYVVPARFAEEAARAIKYVMEFIWYPMDIPILASVKACDTWAAKDDDSSCEAGTFFARIEGENRLFTNDNWSEFMEADRAGLVELKSSCAVLTHNEVAEWRDLIPSEFPRVVQAAGSSIISRKEYERQQQSGK